MPRGGHTYHYEAGGNPGTTRPHGIGPEELRSILREERERAPFVYNPVQGVGSGAEHAGGIDGASLTRIITAIREQGGSERDMQRVAGAEDKEAIIRAINRMAISSEAKAKLGAIALGGEMKEEKKEEKKGSKTGAFMEGSQNIAGGLSALWLNPGMFWNLLLIILLVLFTWIVVQFFPLI